MWGYDSSGILVWKKKDNEFKCLKCGTNHLDVHCTKTDEVGKESSKDVTIYAKVSKKEPPREKSVICSNTSRVKDFLSNTTQKKIRFCLDSNDSSRNSEYTSIITKEQPK